MPSSKGREKRHAHKRKTRDAAGFSTYMARKVCGGCGKQCYLTREEARKSAKVNHPGVTMHAYSCTEPMGKTWWHLSSFSAVQMKELRDRERCYPE